MLTLIEDGPKALKEPENYDVRANVMWAATQALNRFDRRWRTAGTGQRHMLGHETDCDARSGSRANTGYRPACTVE
ncbi:putative alcohol dehydrogenase [Escherichia coli]|uniref:Putative alcohol dehydrogenase n=1 Tax=Escherichia coli TaxID=562 RepID=A0A376MIA3_ECOLX|nr:putative alcohol dehydrogenase [Escherichia coli]